MPVIIFLAAIGFLTAILFFAKPESLPPYLKAIRVGLRAFLVVLVLLAVSAGVFYWWTNRVTLEHKDLIGSWIIGRINYQLLLHEDNTFYLSYNGQIDKGQWTYDEKTKTLHLEPKETTGTEIQKNYLQFTIIKGRKSDYDLDNPALSVPFPFTKSIVSFSFDKDYENKQ